MEQIQTIYGAIPQYLFGEFCKIAGHKTVYSEWVLISDELEFWKLSESGSSVENRKWKKRRGWLPIRDLNFQISLHKTKKRVKSAGGEMVEVNDIPEAIEYAKKNMFIGGKPVYYPDTLPKQNDIEDEFFTSKESKEKPKSYNKILKEFEENSLK